MPNNATSCNVLVAQMAMALRVPAGLSPAIPSCPIAPVRGLRFPLS
jgi:hypothetical protein